MASSVGVALFDVLDEIKDAVRAAGRAGDNGGQAVPGDGERRRDEDGEHLGGAAGAALSGLGGLRAGFLPGADGGEPGTEDVDEPAGIGHGGITAGNGDTEGRGVADELEIEIGQPDDLIGDTDGVVGLAGHVRFFLRG